MNFLLASGAIGTWLDTTFASFDFSVFEFFGHLQSAFLTAVAQIFTTMGSVPYVVLFAVLGVVLLFFKRTRKLGFALIFAVIIGTLLTNVAIKPLVLRIRPYNTLQSNPEYFSWYQAAGMLAESDYSFPSGHTTGATEIAVVLCIWFAANKKKRFAWIFPIAAILTGCSRVYLMVHYATDVLAGFVIGIIAGVVGYLLARVVTRKIENTRLANVDIEYAVRKKKGGRFSNKGIALMVCTAWLVIFLVSFAYGMSFDGENALRCAYDGDYKCYNEAKTSEKYPAIDGEYYCKIHWKQLTAEAENSETSEAETTADPAETETETTAAETTAETAAETIAAEETTE